MTPRRYFEVRPALGGRWAVCHQIAGLAHGLAVDVDFPTRATAEVQRDQLERARQRNPQHSLQHTTALRSRSA